LVNGSATLLGMLAHNVADTVWYRPEVNTLWWLMVALIASYSHISAQEQTKRESLLLSPKVVISQTSGAQELKDMKKSLK